MEDNFYEVSTERLIKPTSKQEERLQKAKNDFERERPIVSAVIKHLQNEIASLEKIDSITETSDPEKFMRQVDVNKKVCSVLKRDLTALEAKVRMFDKNKRQMRQILPVLLEPTPGSTSRGYLASKESTPNSRKKKRR